MGETGTVAETGQKDLRLVVAPEGAVRGKVAFTDGTLPQLFTIQIGMNQQSFMAGDGSFELDGLPPQRYELQVRGPQFQTRAVEVVVESGKTADAGTVQVVAGRGVGGIVTYNGQPVPNATVYAGRVIFGNGTSNSAQFGPMGQGAKTTTTGADGTFSLSGFADGDLAITAEEPTIGRSKALRLPTEMPGQTELTLELQAFGSLSGVLRQGNAPAEGVFVTSQSTTTPGALYAVASGPDGAYRFDRLAPDTYKVSATVGMPMVGMKFYSQQIDVPMGAAVTLDLTADGGAVSLDVTAAPRSATLGVATVWLASGSVSATTATDLGLKLAALGQSASQLVIIRSGEPAHFADLTSGAYSACVVPFPTQVQGMAAQGYAERHGDKLPAYCKPVAVADSPPSPRRRDGAGRDPAVHPRPGLGVGLERLQRVNRITRITTTRIAAAIAIRTALRPPFISPISASSDTFDADVPPGASLTAAIICVAPVRRLYFSLSEREIVPSSL